MRVRDGAVDKEEEKKKRTRRRFSEQNNCTKSKEKASSPNRKRCDRRDFFSICFFFAIQRNRKCNPKRLPVVGVTLKRRRIKTSKPLKKKIGRGPTAAVTLRKRREIVEKKNGIESMFIHELITSVDNKPRGDGRKCLKVRTLRFSKASYSRDALRVS